MSSPKPSVRPSRKGPGKDLATNHRLWERISDEYERLHDRSLGVAGAESWGLFRIPERELRLLGDVRDLDVLEVGCGAARWSISLQRRGARCVGIDFSRSHLAHAARRVRQARSGVALVEGNAERLPFRDARFDLAFCDWGALTFADPERTIPEAARILRPSGRLVFSTANPIRSIAQSRVRSRMGRRLRYDYFGLSRLDYGNEVNFQRTFGEWVRLFRSAGFGILDLLEFPAPPRGRSSYLTEGDRRWARHWPMEAIWRLEKLPSPARGRRTPTRGRGPSKSRRPGTGPRGTPSSRR